MTPQLIDAMSEGKIHSTGQSWERISHIFTQISIRQISGLDNLEFIMVQELFMTDIAKRADIIIGVKVLAMRKRGYM